MKQVLHVALQAMRRALTQHQEPVDYLNRLYGDRASDVADKFQLGYCDEQFTSHIPQEMMFAAKQLGLVNSEGKPLFLKRLVFPVFNEQGRLAGFVGRTLDPTEPAKYVNSPTTRGVYEKSKVLFNIFNAIPHIIQRGQVLVTEGTTDVISGSEFGGVPNIVCTNGTALSDDHINILLRYTNNILLCFDGDKTGRDATTKAYKRIKALKPDALVNTVAMPDDYDLDSWVRNTNGASIHTLAVDILQHRTMEELRLIDPTKVEEIVRLIHMIRPHVDALAYSQWFHTAYLYLFGFSLEEVREEFERRD